jgi:hypothetical protein
VRQASQLLNCGYRVVVDVDVAKVAAGGTSQETVDLVARWVSDGAFLLRLRRALDGLPEPLMPGGGLSPLLLNVRLAPVDAELGGLRVVRFADNYCIFCESQSEATTAYQGLIDALAQRRLKPAADKSGMRLDPNPEDLFLIAG